MTTPRPTRWRRKDARRRSVVRRLLLAGAGVGLAIGLVAQYVMDSRLHGGDLEWLVRGALVLPAIIFIAWWLLFPGIALDEPEELTATPIDPEERLERIEATFDDAAVPRARRARIERVEDGVRETYRASISADRRAPEGVTPASFGVPHPAPRDAAAGDSH